MNNYKNRFFRACTFALLLLIAHLASAQELLKVADWDKESGWWNLYDNTNIPYKGFFNQYGKDLGLTQNDEMVLDKTGEKLKEAVAYRFQQKYKGIKVENAITILHTQNGYVTNIAGHLTQGLNMSVSPQFEEIKALNVSKDIVGNVKLLWEQDMTDSVYIRLKEAHKTASWDKPKAQLVIVDKNQIKVPLTQAEATLAYKFDVYYLDSGHVDGKAVYIDANTGQYLYEMALFHNCSGGTGVTGHVRYPTSYPKTLGYSVTICNPCPIMCCFWIPWPVNDCIWYPCGVDPCCSTTTLGYYQLTNDCSSPNYTINTREDNGLIVYKGGSNHWTNSTPGRATAHWAAAETRDYFWNTFGSSYIANVVDVNFSPNYFNGSNGTFYALGLSYSNIQLGYGNSPVGPYSFATLDIVGHEFAHSVTTLSSNLVYVGESGALDEGFSDIFGEMSEFRTLGNCDYKLGAELYYGNAQDYRNMANPSNSRVSGYSSNNVWYQNYPVNYPDTYNAGNWYNINGCIPNDSTDNCGVHTNSSVLNYWFYLLAEGGNGTNDIGNIYCVQGIGKSKAEQIAYYTQINLAPTDGFIQARALSINMAKTLYGTNSNEVAQVIKAWYAVGVGPNPVTLTSNTPSICAGVNATLSGLITTYHTGSGAPYTVQLYNAAGIVVGSTSTSTNSYSFNVSTAGTYYVVVTDNTGKKVYMGGCPITISTFNNAAIAINLSSLGATNCLEDNMQFDALVNNGMSPFTYSWDIAGQNYNTALVQAAIPAGNQTANLSVTTANGCSASISQSFVSAPNFCGQPYFYPTVNGNDVTLNATDITSSGEWYVYDNSWNYVANYPEGTTTINLTGGDYIICHEKYDCYGAFCTNDCQYVSTCDNLQVSLTGNTPICAGTATTYTANVTGGNGNYTYSWNVSGQTGNSITVSPTVNKTYTVYVTALHSCVTASATIDVIVNPLPTVSISGPTSFCTGGTAFLTANCSTAVSYQWYKTGTPNLLIGATNSTYIPTISGNYYVKVTDANGCIKQSANYNVTVSVAPPANAGADKTVCAGTKTKIGLVGNAAYTYTWSPTSGLATPLKDTSSCITSVNRTYILTVTDPTTGCSRKDTMNVIANPLPPIPVITLNGTNPTCAGVSTLSTATGMSAYQWSLGGNAISGGTSNVLIPTVSGNHRVVVTGANGCTRGSLNYNIIVNPAPPANAGADKTICAGSPVSIGTTNNNAYTYSWSPGLGLSDSIISNPQAFPMDTTQYVLTVTNKNSLCSKKDTMKVITKPLPPTPMLAITTPALPGEDSIIFCEGATNVVLAGTAAGFSSFYWHKNGTSYGAGATSMVSNQALSATGDNFTIKTKGTNSCYSMPSNTIFVQKLAAPQPVIAPAGTNNVIALCGYGTNIGTDTLTASVPANAPSVNSYEWQTSVSGVYVPVTNAFPLPLNDSLSVSVTGTQIKYYRVVVTYENNCQRTSVVKRLEKNPNCKVSDGKNGDEVKLRLEDNVSIFPNPTQDLLNVELSNLEKGAEISLRLFDATGKLVATYNAVAISDSYSTQLRLGQLATGLYSLEVRIDDTVNTYKVAKE